jgi:phage/plasmid-like protein (TIGR03299 family)
MSHELTIRSNGTAEMAYAGEGAWHGLGNKLVHGASIEEWRNAAGMDWSIKRSKVRYATAHGQEPVDTLIDEANHVLFRSDTKAPLAIVSNKFKVVQPAEVLEFFRDLVATNDFELETAGTLFGGRKFWALAKIGEDFTLAGGDKVGGYLNLATACDGSMNTISDFTSVRVVCKNTLNMALSSKSSRCVKLSHRSEFNAADVKAKLGIAHNEFAKFALAAKDLSKAKISVADAQELTLRLLGAKKLATVGGDMAKTQAVVTDIVDGKGFKTVMALFEGKGLGSNLASADGTAWGWVNAVTQYIDYAAPARNQDNRLNSAWFGDGSETKTTALEQALAFI